MDVTKQLKAFREVFEEEAGTLCEPLPVALVLDDVCAALGLCQEERRAVLGADGARYVESVLASRAGIRE
jgi:hypothetical protein